MTILNVVISLFLIFALLILLKLLIWGDEKDKRLQKIFGGIIVFIVALMSKHPGVIATSLFIGGLIVASEDFMKFFAAVIRTRGDKVAETIGALVTQASEEEQDLSIENEVIEAKAAEKITEEDFKHIERPSKSSQSSKSSRFDQITYSTLLPKLEMGTLRYVFKNMHGFEKLEENARFGSHVFDGFTRSKRRRPYFLEVKVFPNITNKKGEIMVRQVITRLKFWLPKVVSAFNSLPSTDERKKPVLLVNLVLNAFGDLSIVKEEVKKLNLQRLSDQVVVKFQYLNLPDLMEKGAFISLSDLGDKKLQNTQNTNKIKKIANKKKKEESSHREKGSNRTL